MNNALGMEIPDRAQHLFHKSGTLGFGIMIIRLFIQSIKEFPTETQFLHEINFGVTLVDLFESDNIGVIELAHDKNFFAQLLKSRGRFDETQIEDFDGVFEPRGLVRDQSDHAGNTGSEDGAIVDSIVDFFNGFAKGDFNVHDILSEGSNFASVFNHFVESNGRS